jgi:hypothetical protein
LRVMPANWEVIESKQNAFNFGEGLRSFLAVEAGTKNARERLRSLAREMLGVVRACNDALRQPERLANVIHDDAETDGIELSDSEVRSLVADHSALHLLSRGFGQKEGWDPWICRIAEICKSTGLPTEARKDTSAPKTRKIPSESPFVKFVWCLQQQLPVNISGRFTLFNPWPEQLAKQPRRFGSRKLHHLRLRKPDTPQP